MSNTLLSEKHESISSLTQQLHSFDVNKIKSIHHLLHERAQESPDNPLFIFSQLSQQNDTIYTYKTIDQRSKAVAHYLNSLSIKKGSRIILLFPQSIDFIDSFFGCLFGDYIAVPAYPPSLSHQEIQLNHIIKDCEPTLILTTKLIKEKLNRLKQKNKFDFEGSYLCIEDIDRNKDLPLNPSTSNNDDISFLQYTSGSTGNPKGVMVTHGNILENEKMIKQWFGHTETTLIGVGWLPFYHDMGLIGNLLQPIYTGGSCVLTPSVDVLKKPLHWLNLISRYNATTSGAPNFMYDLCCQKISYNDIKTLDLSSWTLAFIGAEPVNPDTLENFYLRFKECGFNKTSFYPCYGMAEATLMIAGGHSNKVPILKTVNKEDFEKNIIRSASSAHNKTTLIGCGKSVNNNSIHIVNPDTLEMCKTHDIGEIWVQGPHIAKGYWNNEFETEKQFHAYLSDTKDGPYLRTGDLGFQDETGELFITSRLKDLIIINGKNYSPHDIENSLKKSDLTLPIQSCACISVTTEDGSEALVIIVELNRQVKKSDYPEIYRNIISTISTEYLLSTYDIVFLKTNTMPKTSSGKIQRQRSKVLYLNKSLSTLSTYINDETNLKNDSSYKPSTDCVEKSVYNALSSLNKNLDETMYKTKSLSQLGLDSLQRHDLHARLESELNITIDHQTLIEDMSVSDLCDYISKRSTDKHSGSIKQSISSEVAQFQKWVKEIENTGLSMHDLRTTSPDSKILFTKDTNTEFINFSSYNYLGLSTHPDVIASAKNALDHYGLSASSSPLAGGYTSLHAELEGQILDLYGLKNDHGVSLFNSGYSANTGSISSLMKAQGTIICDEYCHMSILEGARLSGAKLVFFKHNDAEDLRRVLSSSNHATERLVCIESLYSTEGDFAPIKEIIAVVKEFNALILVDEAHSALISGDHGRGVVEEEGIQDQVDFIILTFSKAFGGIGGALIAKKEITTFVNFHAKSRMFSCGLDPVVTGGLIKSIQIAQTNEGGLLREKIKENADYLRKKLASLYPVSNNKSWIIPIEYGNEALSLAIKKDLHAKGIYAGFLQYPAVPKGKARLRLFITAHHSQKQLDKVYDILKELKETFRL